MRDAAVQWYPLHFIEGTGQKADQQQVAKSPQTFEL